VGLGAPEPMELVEGFVALCHATCVTLLEEWATTPCSLAGATSRSPRALDAGALGSSSALSSDWRWSQGSSPGYHRLGSQSSGEPPKSRAEAEGLLGFRPILG
jgi:hypothetical protein